MKFTVSWLREHLDTDATLEEITDKLTAIGLEVEEVSDRAAGLEAFVVGYVVDARPHPNANKLRLCIVDHARGKRKWSAAPPTPVPA